MEKEKHDPFDISAQEKSQSDTETRARLAQKAEEDDYQWLMSSRRGRRVVWRLLEQAGVFRSSFNPTAMQMAFNEGNRNFGIRTLGLIHQYCPELYPQMMKENTDAR